MTKCSEAFGITAVESQMAGIPVAYTAWSSLTETCDNIGNFPIEYTYDEAYSMGKYGYQINTYYAIPKMSSIMNAISHAYELWQYNRINYFVDSRTEMVNRYSIDAVIPYIKIMLGE